MEFTLKLEKEDWRAFNNYICKKLAAKTKTLFNNFFVNVFAWMIIGFSIVFTIKRLGGIHWPTAAITAMIFVFAYFAMFYRNKKARAAFEPMDNGSFCRERTFKFSEEGMSTGDGIVPWDLILQIERAQGMIILYLDTVSALVFPERKLEHPDKFYDYISALHSNATRQ